MTACYPGPYKRMLVKKNACFIYLYVWVGGWVGFLNNMLFFCFSNSQKLQVKEQVAHAFLDKFQLKPEEIKILRGTRDGALQPVSFICPPQQFVNDM